MTVSGLDHGPISHHDGVVIGFIVPGEPVPKLREYKCTYSGCTYTTMSEVPPVCPRHRRRMVPA
jgi:hypothetical protein